MEIVKYCKKQHNIKEGCPTLHLGTFDYYRNLDPNFSIADAEEGFINYFCKPTPDLVIDSKLYNNITGGAVQLIDKDSPSPAKALGAVQLNMKGGEFIGQEDGSTLIKPGEIESKVNYPNSYIFCCSIVENIEEIDPSKISKDYDSFYKIPEKNINEFGTKMCQLITQNLAIGDIKYEDEKLTKSHILTLGQTPIVKFMHGPVQYVEDKTITLSKPQDFEEHSWTKIYFESMFKKDKKYETDKEYRFVFIIEHPVHRILPVIEKPKIITLNPLSELLK